MDYKTHGVCSSMIHVELDGDKIKDVDFVGGCNFLPGSASQSTPRSNRSVN